MNTTEFAALKGCSSRTVLRAIETGAIPPSAVRRRGKGRHRSVEIIDPELAARAWEPSARFPSDTSTPREATPAVEPPDGCDFMWASCIEETVGPVMGIPRAAKKLIPGLSAKAVEILTGLCADALAGLIPDEESAKNVVRLIEDDANEAIVKELIRRHGRRREKSASTTPKR